jgi:hypothetical protein
LRGHLQEFGLIAAKGIHRVQELVASRWRTKVFPKRPSKPPLCWPGRASNSI